ncbi:MAG: head-tail adaptor protein [Devosia sp.]|uniref:phage head closure protein n=1 Tax=Devosia sp. TaxID=1871048 RepID=UPI002627F31C|nr:phage head closure protein [Devosia sp.]MDB5541073.1 head-tail adaptor protein [Devosia sp.]
MSEAAPAVGSLTDRVSFQRRETTGEDDGGHAVLFVPVTTLWARVRALSGRQVAEADGRGVAVSHSVVVRFRTDVKAGDRFGYRGRWLSVVSAGDLNGRRGWLSCACVETGVVG